MSGQLEKWGIGLSLRLRGEKPIEPCRGRCSFGTGHSSDRVVSRRVRRRGVLSRHRDAACDPRRIGPAFPGSENGLPGVVWSTRWAVPMEGAYITLCGTRLRLPGNVSWAIGAIEVSERAPAVLSSAAQAARSRSA